MLSSVLVVGCGSIGQRHIANLQKLGIEKIFAYDQIPERIHEMENLFGVEPVGSLASGLNLSTEAVVVCTPPTHHISVARKAIESGSNVFIEKPISNSIEGIDVLLKDAEQKRLVLMVGYNLRFHLGLKKMKSLVDSKTVGDLIAVHAEFGQYLPDWRPNQDYRQGYFAQPNQGGGIILDLSHEIDYVRWLIGEIHEVYACASTISDLDISSEDFAVMILKSGTNTVASVRLDCIQRGYWRNCKVIGSEGTLIWEFAEGVKVLGNSGKVVEEFRISPDVNDMYLLEMEHFLACIDGHMKPPVDGRTAKRILEIALAAKNSAEIHREVQI